MLQCNLPLQSTPSVFREHWWACCNRCCQRGPRFPHSQNKFATSLGPNWDPPGTFRTFVRRTAKRFRSKRFPAAEESRLLPSASRKRLRETASSPSPSKRRTPRGVVATPKETSTFAKRFDEYCKSQKDSGSIKCNVVCVNN